jgi:ERCC4-type nuclease
MPGSIVVDTHAGETALYAALVRLFDDATVTRRKLDVGDVMLVADAGTVYVERKTWLDLASSLIDRRYVEQKARLRSLVAQGGGGGGEAAAAAAAAVYLVEGALTGWSGKVGGGSERLGGVARMNNAQVEAAVVMTSVRDGVPVLRSKDTAHSAALVGYLFDKLRAGELLPPPSGGGGAAAASGYAGLVTKKRRRDNMTTETTWEVMLAQVSGMSAHKAAALAKVYPSMAALAAASEAELAAVMVPPAGREAKAARRLGPAVAQRLAQL